jgi:hypothetical protein
MISFLCKWKPRSVRAKLTDKYKQAILDGYRKYYPEPLGLLDGELYGIAYYFYKGVTQLDADNLSKPIWDALESAIYRNDKAVKIRFSGIYQIGRPGSVEFLDMTTMPVNVQGDFLELIDEADHLIYIEIGHWSPGLYRMGVEL